MIQQGPEEGQGVWGVRARTDRIMMAGRGGALVQDRFYIYVGRALRCAGKIGSGHCSHFSVVLSYHFTGFASYRLYSNNRTLTRLGRKQAFCLEDFVSGYTGQRSLLPRHDCNNQGISRGWQGVYVAGLDCQWIDITGITIGSYWLYVEINPLINGRRAFTESSSFESTVFGNLWQSKGKHLREIVTVSRKRTKA